jgi:hypothetical protein
MKKVLSILIFILVAPAMASIAFGDVHGDYWALLKALKLAKVINEDLKWIGGKTHVVQVGDQLDRGAGERKILDLLERLRAEAHKVGGGVHPLVGNHETMNLDLDFRYVFPGGWKTFQDQYDPELEKNWIRKYPLKQRGRVMAFMPGGTYAKILGGHNIVQVIGDTLFVHGGISPKYAAYGINRINSEYRAWALGKGKRPGFVSDSNGPLWSRAYSNEVNPKNCQDLGRTLKALKLKRMVVAHTVQRNGINSKCEGRVIRVDVGLSQYYGGNPQVLEIVGEKLKVVQ